MKSLFRILIILTITVVLLVAGGCKNKPAAEKPAVDPARIEAAENALKPALYEKGKPPAAMNILDRMKHYHVPGVSVAVINEGKIEWAKGYGVKETGGQDPVTPETLFQAASISKPVTALGVLRLVEKGILDLDAPVNDKLVSWKVPENEFYEKRKSHPSPPLDPQRRVDGFGLSRIRRLRTDPHARSSAQRRKTGQYSSGSHRHGSRIPMAVLRGRIRGDAASRGGCVRPAFSGIYENNGSGPPGNDPQHV